MLKKMANIDRRIIYALIWLVVLFPLVRPIGLPIPITPEARKTFDWIHANLKAGDPVLIDVDFDPSSAPELLPQLIAVTKDLMNMRIRIVLASFLPGAFVYQDQIVAQIAPSRGYQYGTDLLSLPFKAGNESAYNALGRDMGALYTEDYYGKPLGDAPLWQDVRSAGDFRAVFTFCSGDQGVWMIRQVGQVLGTPVLNGTVASSGAYMTPYWQSGQLTGFVVGMSGAAEYETLAGFPGAATSGMDAQSFGHLLIAGLIVVGNAGHLATRRKERAGR